MICNVLLDMDTKSVRKIMVGSVSIASGEMQVVLKGENVKQKEKELKNYWSKQLVIAKICNLNDCDCKLHMKGTQG